MRLPGLALAGSATAALCVAAAVLAPAATAQITTLVQKPGLAGCIAISYGATGPCAPGRAVGGASSVVVSPDGANAYGASNYAITVFDRAADGSLTQKAGTAGCIGYPNAGFEIAPGMCATGVALSGMAALAVSSDGKSVYVAATTADAVLVFDRSADGTLTQKAGLAGCVSDTGAGPCADGVGLDYVQSVTVSPDGKSIYVGGADSDAIAVFDRGADGSLTQKPGLAGCVSDTGAGPCLDGTALDYVTDLAASPDGRSLYAISLINGVVVLDRAADGTLTPKAGTDACVSSNATPGACAAGMGLFYPRAVTVSPDGSSVYVASDGSLAVFDRSASGALTQTPGAAGCLTTGRDPGCAPAIELDGAASVAVTPDGTGVYVASSQPMMILADYGAVVVFDRATDGTLAQKPGAAGCVSIDGSGGSCVDGTALQGAQSVAVSPDGSSAYVAALVSGAIAIFDKGPFVAPPPPPPPPPGPPKDTTKPLLRGLSVRPARFRALRNGPTVVARGSARISFRLSENATVRFAVQRVAVGRRAGKSCVPAARKPTRAAKRCDRYRAPAGYFLGLGQRGTNALRFSGRLNDRRLRVGRYRLLAVAGDDADNRSRVATARFAIRR